MKVSWVIWRHTYYTERLFVVYLKFKPNTAHCVFLS